MPLLLVFSLVLTLARALDLGTRSEIDRMLAVASLMMLLMFSFQSTAGRLGPVASRAAAVDGAVGGADVEDVDPASPPPVALAAVAAGAPGPGPLLGGPVVEVDMTTRGGVWA